MGHSPNYCSGEKEKRHAVGGALSGFDTQVIDTQLYSSTIDPMCQYQLTMLVH